MTPNPFAYEAGFHLAAADLCRKERDVDGYKYHFKKMEYFQRRYLLWETLAEICQTVDRAGKK